MPTKVEAYACSFCGKVCKSITGAKNHEHSCNKNPAKRHCQFCVHGIMAVKGYEPDITDLDGPGIEIKVPYCGYFDRPIHDEPYFEDCDTTRSGYGIPFTCNVFKAKEKAEWTPERQYSAERNDTQDD